MSPRKSNTPLVAGAPKSLDQGLLAAVRRIWEGARTHAARTVNTAMVQANWFIGWQIVESQQAGEGRAGYGEELLKNLSSALRAEYGTGFSLTGLKYMRAFYLAYPNLIPISHAVRGLSSSALDSTGDRIGHASRDPFEAKAGWKPGMLHSSLSWMHYRALLKVDRQDARDFYEIEARKKR